MKCVPDSFNLDHCPLPGCATLTKKTNLSSGQTVQPSHEPNLARGAADSG